jgi:hypothetical protein
LRQQRQECADLVFGYFADVWPTNAFPSSADPVDVVTD